jgi:hypothetical protein
MDVTSSDRFPEPALPRENNDCGIHKLPSNELTVILPRDASVTDGRRQHNYAIWELKVED